MPFNPHGTPFAYQPIVLVGTHRQVIGYEQLLDSYRIEDVESTLDVFTSGLAAAVSLLPDRAPMISINVEPDDLPYAVLELEQRSIPAPIWLEVVERGRADLSPSVLRWADTRGTVLVADDVALVELVDLPAGYRVVKVDISELSDLTGARWFVAEAARRGMSVVVERVETVEQLRLVEGLGVTMVQGFYAGRPVHLEGQQRLAV